MFDDHAEARRATLIAGLILLIVLLAVAAMSAVPTDMDPPPFGVPATAARFEAHGLTRSGCFDDDADLLSGIGTTPASSRLRMYSAAAERLSAEAHRGRARMLDALSPIEDPLSGVFPENALMTYDLGIAPRDAVDFLADLLETVAPDIFSRVQSLLDDFQRATGLDAESGFLSHLGRGLTVGLLPAEDEDGGWPFPRKVVIARVIDSTAVSRFLEAWVVWEAGAVAPMTHGVLGAFTVSEVVGGVEVFGLQLDGLVPASYPLPSPSYAVAGDLLITSPVRSGVLETLRRLEQRATTRAVTTRGEAVVESVWLNFPEWPLAWRRAEPYVRSLLDWIGADTETTTRACIWMVRHVAEFEPAHGTTELTPDGGFVFRLEVAPRLREPTPPGS